MRNIIYIKLNLSDANAAVNVHEVRAHELQNAHFQTVMQYERSPSAFKIQICVLVFYTLQVFNPCCHLYLLARSLCSTWKLLYSRPGYSETHPK